jgi:hypothetical protein
VTCINGSPDGSGTPGAPAVSIATSRQATQAVTDVIGRTSTLPLSIAIVVRLADPVMVDAESLHTLDVIQFEPIRPPMSEVLGMDGWVDRWGIGHGARMGLLILQIQDETARGVETEHWSRTTIAHTCQSSTSVTYPPLPVPTCFPVDFTLNK